MAIRAIVFDIGGVLEITPDPRMQATSARWDARLKRTPGDLDAKMAQLWQAGSLGQCSEADVARGLCELGGLSQDEADAYMADLWRAYLGTLNVELTDYFRGLRPRYQTGIISNSFVGAREREQALYQFEQMADPIIYSHEVGIAKPNPRIYEMACDRMSVRPAEMIFLDDAEVCVTAANDLGIHGILFRETSQAIAAIEACLRANA